MRVPRKFVYILAAIISLLLQSFSTAEIKLPNSGDAPNLAIASDDLPLVRPVSFDNLQDIDQAKISPSTADELSSFVQSIIDGSTDTVRGLYVKDKFAYPVVQQPASNAGFVSTVDDVITDFTMPKEYGVTGLLAHNYLAGGEFFLLNIGDLIQVVYGDGSIKNYQVADIQSYQALSPNSPNSSFIDLATSDRLTATQLFKRVYMGSHHLTLQTCIQQGSEDSWGRLFIIAYPV